MYSPLLRTGCLGPLLRDDPYILCCVSEFSMQVISQPALDCAEFEQLHIEDV